MPAPRVFPRAKKPVTSEYHNRSQITDHREREKEGTREREKETERETEKQRNRDRIREKGRKMERGE